MRATILLAVAALGAPASAQHDEAASELGNRRPGPEQTCIDERRADDTVVFPGTILFRQSGRRIWRMTPADCPFLRWDVHLRFYSNGGRLCRGDRFAVFPPGSTIPLGPCRMGGFIPYDKDRS